jgi:hypothetical protein
LIKQAGFDDDQTDTILTEAYTLNEILEAWDRRAVWLKTDKEDHQGLQPITEIPKLQKERADRIAKTVDKWLPERLGKDGTAKLRNFIDTGVKRNIQKILLNDSVGTKKIAVGGVFAKSFAPKKFGKVEESYITTRPPGVTVLGFTAREA